MPSDLYSLSFEQNPDWSRTFASQQEILDYLRRVAAKHQVEASVQFDTDIVALRWNETHQHWQLTAADGRQFTATVVISGMGGLHIPAIPKLPGEAAFTGTSFHTAQWRHDVDLTGKRVAVIGTGASAVQIIPEIAGRVEQLTVFQRTPPWVLPRNNRPTSVWTRWLKRYVPGLQLAQRLALFWKAEPIAIGFTLKPKAMGSGQKRAKQFIQSQVQDPVLRNQLTPQYSMGCKRVLLSDDYYAAFTRRNVELVTRPIARLVPEGVVTGNGQRWPADVVIYATGFKPFNPTHRVKIVGRGNRILADDWADGPEAFKGVAVSGYPNFFMLMGPNSGLGHNSILVMIEAQVGYILKCLTWLRKPGRRKPWLLKPWWRGRPWQSIEIKAEQQQDYNDWLHDQFKRSVWRSDNASPSFRPCSSWYSTATGKNFSLWPSFATAYTWAMRRPEPSCFFDASQVLATADRSQPERSPLRRAA
ncbi:MAG: NAD(P)/FAD-dependent oxidoreductase [Planctomycetia bacterium]|nr:NAD(P)/FAD-dependent oxidoreductase [Planctomycetia bacterium]